MNATEFWRRRAGERYRDAWVSTCPATRATAMLAAADCLDMAMITESRPDSPRTAKIIPFAQRAA
jgi:hypothetical protein